jgi:KDO2-lipid IV(A) lauroyltransferase
MIRRAGHLLGYAGYLWISAMIFFIPRPICLALGAGFGRLAYRLDRSHRRIALANLDIAFGRTRSPAEKDRIARASLAAFGRVVFDVIKFCHYGRKAVFGLVDIEGRENLLQALAGGRGVLMFSAHFGNWEVLPAVAGGRIPFHAIVRALDNPYIDRHLSRLRTRLGTLIINKFGASRPILQALRRGEIVCILIDQNVLRSQALFVDFFGRPAGTTPGLAAFQAKTGAALLPVFCLPRGRRYVLRILPPPPIAASERRTDAVLKITQFCTKIVEQEIRRFPEAWLWIHKRWNARPPDEGMTP